jgi:hypothetical protein
MPSSAPFQIPGFQPPSGTKPTNEFSASQSRLTMTLCNFTSREDDRYRGMCGILVRLGRLAKNIAPAVLHCFALFCIVSRHHTILGSCGFLHTLPVTIYQKSLSLSLSLSLDRAESPNKTACKSSSLSLSLDQSIILVSTLWYKFEEEEVETHGMTSKPDRS